MRDVVRIWKALLLICFNLASIFFIMLVILLTPESPAGMRIKTLCMTIWARCSCAILGVRIRKTGAAPLKQGCFIVANHCSYLDILVLGSVTPAVFVAKKEVASWFLIGGLAWLAGTIFVNRSSKKSVLSTMIEIEDRLDNGISVILFPEGTTNNGAEILAFKSSFFQLPIESQRPVLPVSLLYSDMDGKRIDENMRTRIAWYGNMGMLPHLWNILGAKRIDVKVHFNPVIQDFRIVNVSTRKELASYACESVKSGHELMLNGECLH